MQDFNELLAAFRAQSSGAPQLSALEQFMHSPQGQGMAQGLSQETTARIAQAAQAAGQGDREGAQAAVAAILRTPEGAALAAQIKNLLGK